MSDKHKYQFSGYQLPLIQLDATGPAYIYAKQTGVNVQFAPLETSTPIFQQDVPSFRGRSLGGLRKYPVII
jgi:hypothetical protein